MLHVRNVFMFLFFFIYVVFGLNSDTRTELTEITGNSEASVSKEVTMNTHNINYFEVGFITEEYSGNGSPAISNDVLPLILNNDGYASTSIYVFWAYATDDKFSIELSMTPLAFEDQDTIAWKASNGTGINITPESNPYIWEFNQNGHFSSDFEEGVLLNLETTEPIEGKIAGLYDGALVLTITSDQGEA